MFTLTVAGHETTGSTLTFLFYELARKPEYQERMREEIRQLRAKVADRGDTEFTTEDLDTLTATMNAIRVSLFGFYAASALTCLWGRRKRCVSMQL